MYRKWIFAVEISDVLPDYQIKIDNKGIVVGMTEFIRKMKRLKYLF